MAQELRDWLSQIGSPDDKVGRHPHDDPLQSSLNDVKNFEETVIWNDIETLCDERIEILREKLTNATDLDTIRRLQERIKAWEAFSLMPEMLKNFITGFQNEPSQTNGRSS